jgi:hypothetical protein
MANQNPPRDSDPSEMTDFEKNATLDELERVIKAPEPDRTRQEKAKSTPDRTQDSPD